VTATIPGRKSTHGSADRAASRAGDREGLRKGSGGRAGRIER